MQKETNTEPPQRPEGWGEDAITQYLDCTHNNCYATFHNRKGEFHHFSLVNNVFRKAINHCGSKHSNHTKDEQKLISIFLMQSHSSYLSAVGLCMSCQFSGAYALMRTCLEHSFYGAYIAERKTATITINKKTKKEINLAECWIKRNDNEEYKTQMKKAFQIRIMKDFLFGTEENPKNKDLRERWENCYEETIDYGAHPNIATYISSLRINGDKNTLDYISKNEPLFIKCAIETIEAGVCALRVFEILFPKWYELGLHNRLKEIDEKHKRALKEVREVPKS